MSDRIGCCIPGCRRTWKREAGDDETIETMCGRHYRMSDERMRVRHKQLLKRVRWFNRRWRTRQNAIERSPRYRKFDAAWYRASVAANKQWDVIKEDVTIKVAMGAEAAPRRKPARETEGSGSS